MGIVITVRNYNDSIYKVIEREGVALIYQPVRHDKQYRLTLIGEIDLNIDLTIKEKIHLIFYTLGKKIWLPPFTLIECEEGVWRHE